MTGHLIMISGLPGVGKTSVAEIAAARTGSVHLSIDAVEEWILACGLTRGWQVGVAAYEAARAMAELNLRLGRSVIIDAVNDSEDARQTWRAAAARTSSRIDFVHLVVADAQEHERRLSGRDRGLAYVGEPTWTDVQRRRADYAAWSDEVVELDTTVGLRMRLQAHLPRASARDEAASSLMVLRAGTRSSSGSMHKPLGQS